MSYRGKIRNVRWHREERTSQYYEHSHDWHSLSESCILADLYPSPHNRIPDEDMYVDITSDVLEYYNRQRISWNLINEVNDLLHNVWINYYNDDYDGKKYLDGYLSDYVD